MHPTTLALVWMAVDDNLDNIFIERLWRSVKQECIYQNQFESVKEVKNALQQYFQYYNKQRPHQALNYRTPYEAYFQ